MIKDYPARKEIKQMIQLLGKFRKVDLPLLILIKRYSNLKLYNLYNIHLSLKLPDIQ